MNQTCTWCREQVAVDKNGETAYHDFPKPGRAVCRGAKYPSIEKIAETDQMFQFLVADFIQDPHDEIGAFDQARCDVLAARFETPRSWPISVATGKANPHPRLRKQVVEWICEQNRNQE